MKVLIALGGTALLRQGEAAAAARRRVEAAAAMLAEIAAEHEAIIAHDSGTRLGAMLELELRNALPDRDVITVLSQVAVNADAAAPGRSPVVRSALEPHAIVELRSLRTLIGAGVLVICAGAGSASIAVDDAGTMRGIDAAIDRNLTMALLARRLDADLLLLLNDIERDQPPGSMGSMVEAACRFVEATGHRAAIGALTDAVRIVHGAAGTQIAPPRA
jgi:carbamate kinase